MGNLLETVLDTLVLSKPGTAGPECRFRLAQTSGGRLKNSELAFVSHTCGRREGKADAAAARG